MAALRAAMSQQWCGRRALTLALLVLVLMRIVVVVAALLLHHYSGWCARQVTVARGGLGRDVSAPGEIDPTRRMPLPSLVPTQARETHENARYLTPRPVPGCFVWLHTKLGSAPPQGNLAIWWVRPSTVHCLCGVHVDAY